MSAPDPDPTSTPAPATADTPADDAAQHSAADAASAPVVAVLGGTGPQGRGLARRLALAGVHVVLGSRDAGRAAAAAAELPGQVTGAANAEAARVGEEIGRAHV